MNINDKSWPLTQFVQKLVKSKSFYGSTTKSVHICKFVCGIALETTRSLKWSGCSRTVNTAIIILCSANWLHLLLSSPGHPNTTMPPLLMSNSIYNNQLLWRIMLLLCVYRCTKQSTKWEVMGFIMKYMSFSQRCQGLILGTDVFSWWSHPHKRNKVINDKISKCLRSVSERQKKKKSKSDFKVVAERVIMGKHLNC